MKHFDRAQIFVRRIKAELGYRSVKAWPIYDKKGSSNVMYYMIHASDHDEAPALMVRAHHKAVRALPPEVQRRFTFQGQ